MNQVKERKSYLTVTINLAKNKVMFASFSLLLFLPFIPSITQYFFSTFWTLDVDTDLWLRIEWRRKKIIIFQINFFFLRSHLSIHRIYKIYVYIEQKEWMDKTKKNRRRDEDDIINVNHYMTVWKWWLLMRFSPGVRQHNFMVCI